MADEPEIVKAAGLEDKEWENDISEQALRTVQLLNHYKNKFFFRENEEDIENYMDIFRKNIRIFVIMARTFSAVMRTTRWTR